MIPALNIPNQLLIRDKELSDDEYDIFENFLKAKKYNEISWLLLLL